MQSVLTKKNYPVLDFARLFCAFLVVVLHAFEVPSAGSVWEFLCACFFEQAVPFFFVVSGFFFARKMQACACRLREVWLYVRGRLLLYAAWTVLWMPYLLHIYLNKYPDASAAYLAALLIRRIVLAGSGVYWYVLVMAEAAAVIGILMHLKLEKLLYALALAGLALRYCYDLQFQLPVVTQVNGLFYYVFSWSNNVVMSGLPFMTVGVLFAQRLHKTAVPGGVLIAGYAVSSALHVLLYFSFGAANGNLSCSLLFPVQTVCLFWFGLQTPVSVKPQTALAAREISAVVYFMHTVFIYGVFDAFLGVDSSVTLKVFGSIALSVGTYALVRVLHFKPLHWLFGMKYTKRIPEAKETTA